MEDAKAIIASSELKILGSSDLDEAAMMVRVYVCVFMCTCGMG